MTTPAGASMADDEQGNEREDLERLELPLPGVEPLFWRILVAPVRPQQTTKGGIILADQTFEAAEHLNYIGMVVAIGAGAMQHQRLKEGYENAGPPFALGNWVIYKRYAGLKMVYKGLRILAVNDDDILLRADSPDGWRVLV